MQVSRFNHDRFEKVDVFSLVEGDQIVTGGEFVIVKGPAYKKDGNVHLPAHPANQPVMQIDFSDTALTRAMTYVGSSVHEFGDGTAMIAELDGSSDLVYSPRLPKADLEEFCAEHLDRYHAFYDANCEAVEDGQKLPMAPWWD